MPATANVGEVRDDRSIMLFTVENAKWYRYFGGQFLTKLQIDFIMCPAFNLRTRMLTMHLINNYSQEFDRC